MNLKIGRKILINIWPSIYMKTTFKIKWILTGVKPFLDHQLLPHHRWSEYHSLFQDQILQNLFE